VILTKPHRPAGRVRSVIAITQSAVALFAGADFVGLTLPGLRAR
jgi:hypothetical protein